MPENLYNLSDIVEDLWGATPVPKREPGENEEIEAAQPEQPEYRSTFPPFEQLWKTADDAVDWTDALAHDKPTDGLTSAHLWAFFHQHAEKVLQGDTAAYVEVLKAANPLGDLTSYAKAFDVETASADRLVARFQPNPAYLDKEEPEIRRYLCAVALRVARDLMALLPVREVEVQALRGESTLLQVVFDRGELQKVRFSFIDPVTFVAGCGAEFK
ncbi:MAG: hypothetical protein E7316_05410 [Clostridiales bacterium]|nr:hypothetical protein [Clostridiales bacterium]